MKTGIIIRSKGRAREEPIKVSKTAEYPCPLRRSRCPGITLKILSSSGAPRKMLGIKFRKVWVIAIAVINIIIVSG